jgi:hypothetical protein
MRGLTLEHRTVAAVALAGTALNLFGGLYLAYDLFGGKHGALRTVTRAVTYGVLFFAGYLTVLPFAFSAPAAIGAGGSLAVEFARAARHSRRSRAVEAAASAVRSASYGVGCMFLFDWRFGASFAFLTFVGQVAAYNFGFRPTMVLDPQRRWGKHLLGVANRTIGHALAGLVSAAVAHEHGPTVLWFGIEMGVAIGSISAVLGIFCPVIEEWADSLPARRLGLFGTLLLFCGFLLESVPEWLTLFDIPVK